MGLKLKATPSSAQAKAAAEQKWCTCGAKTPQGKFHKVDCPAHTE